MVIYSDFFLINLTSTLLIEYSIYEMGIRDSSGFSALS